MRFEEILPTLATKADVAECATKADVALCATKADLALCATKADLERFATKDDLKGFPTVDDPKGFVTTEALKKELATEMAAMREFVVEQVRHLHTAIRDGRAEVRVLIEAERDRWTAVVDQQNHLLEALGLVDIAAKDRDTVLDGRITALDGRVSALEPHDAAQ